MRLAERGLIQAFVAAVTLSWAAVSHAASPDADAKIAVAQASLHRAEEAGAPQSAPVELEAARSKLARAQKAELDRNLKDAADLADQANIDAQVAEASARAQRSHAAAVEFDASIAGRGHAKKSIDHGTMT
jgi:hypothetical protein